MATGVDPSLRTQLHEPLGLGDMQLQAPFAVGHAEGSVAHGVNCPLEPTNLHRPSTSQIPNGPNEEKVSGKHCKFTVEMFHDSSGTPGHALLHDGGGGAGVGASVGLAVQSRFCAPLKHVH
jgi:hypothetical protein